MVGVCFYNKMSALEVTTVKNHSRKHTTKMNSNSRKELTLIAKAENVPYSGLNKRALIDRIQHYRDTVGTLYREKRGSLKALAKAEGIRGYGRLNKGMLIDTI